MSVPLRSPWLSFVCALLLVSLAATAQEEAATTATFSLQLAPGQTLPGYFPLGFVRGDSALSVAAGFSQVQDAVQSRDFVAGADYPAPSPYQQDPWNLRYFSLALAADSLPGAREQLDLFAPATVLFLQRYAEAHVASRVNSPLAATVHLWGLDNEWEAPAVFSPMARAPFLAWLHEAYADDIGGLNEAWETQFADFDASVVADPPTPQEYHTRPGAFLDWHAFATEHFLQLLLAQARAMHTADPRQRGVVHKSTQLTLERPATSRTRLFDHGRFAELMRPYSGGLYGIDMYGAGDRQAYETSYLFNSIRPQDRAPGYGVLLTETNNHEGSGSQFASTFWRLLANGAKGMMFFTQGNPAARPDSDWNRYGMRDSATGRFTDRWYFAARLAAAIHRSERFWSEAVPAPGLPRIAMLQPRRDVLLAASSGRDPAEGRFAYARNERWRVYRWLREQGYWVDVLPYEKLTDAYLRDYAALLLIGAEHLSAEEGAAALRYAENGGVLVADTMPGYFDEHHRVRNTFAAAAGVAATRNARGQQVELGGTALTGVTTYTVTPRTAEVLERDTTGRPRVLLQAHGQGRILALPFELGSLRASTRDDEDGRIGAWLGKQLALAGLRPAYASSHAEAAVRILRVEQPQVDAAGNLALVVTTRAQENQEVLPAGRVNLPLPGGPWKRAWWAAAENNALLPVEVESVEGMQHRIELPAFATAGILYFFRDHPPLLGFGQGDVAAHATDGLAPRVQPGVPFTLPVQVLNVAKEPFAIGAVRVQVPPGWSVEPEQASTPILQKDELHTLTFTVTPSADVIADRPYPVIAHWNDGAADRAVLSTLVEGAPSVERTALLLTGNASYPRHYPHRLDTGATYRHLAPEAALIDDSASAQTGGALLNGFGSVGGERDSFNRGGHVQAHYVRYRAAEAEVLFDLQAPRQITRIHVVNGPGRVTPLQMEAYTSADGEEFLRSAALKTSMPALETVFSLPRVAARYVKLRVVWPATGGTLDEVEIWGR